MTDAATPVLDHGFVRLTDHMGDDLAVVRAARSSFDAAWRAGVNEGSDTRLIHYLMRHRHSTPFEAVELQFQVRAPFFVFRQWTRHRTWKYLTINEVSARYTELPDEFYVPDAAIVGEQSLKNKQGRRISPLSQPDAGLIKNDLRAYRSTCAEGFRRYHDLLERGWPRELARCVLPVATYSTMSVKVDLHNFLQFVDLRSWEDIEDFEHPGGAQYEIAVYANTMLELVRPIVPVCVGAWEKNR